MVEINLWAVLVAGVAAYVIGALWYGFLFQKQWMKVTGFDTASPEEMKKMSKQAGPLYAIQLVITFIQAYVLAHIIDVWQQVDATSSAIEASAWMLVGFVLPTLMEAVMWTGGKQEIHRLQIAIQTGCKIVTVMVMGIIIGLWQ